MKFLVIDYYELIRTNEKCGKCCIQDDVAPIKRTVNSLKMAPYPTNE